MTDKERNRLVAEIARLRGERDTLIDGMIYCHVWDGGEGFTAFPDESLEKRFPTKREAVAYVREIFGLPREEGT